MKRKGSFRIGVDPVFSESKAFKDLPFQNRCFEGHISSGFSRRGSLSHVRVAAEAWGGFRGSSGFRFLGIVFWNHLWSSGGSRQSRLSFQVLISFIFSRVF